MSRLEKLTIQGIRAFNPKEKNTLVFYTPLTLIVGANGTGKTTIIECLKYATTGDLPPNSRGGAFVNDPKVARQIDVRAEVSLLFRSNRNELLHCIRVIQSSSRKSHDRSLEQKTLECSLMKDVVGKEVLITSKLADVDRTVPIHLGVSQSILENVIFCHQDESTWPIGDPTVMKKKLDEIFSSTKYSKALLGLKGAKKEIGTDLKLKRQELLQLHKEKQRRDGILKRVEEGEREIERKKRKYREYEEEANRLEATGRVLDEELRIAEKVEERNRELRRELEECVRFINNFGNEILEEVDKEGAERRLREAEEKLRMLNDSRIEEEFRAIESIRQLVLEERENNRKRENRIGIYEHEMKGLIEELEASEIAENNEITLNNEITQNSLEEIKRTEIEFEREKEAFLVMKSEERRAEIEMNQKKEFIKRYLGLKKREIEIGDIEIDYKEKDKLEDEIDELLLIIEKKEGESERKVEEEVKRRVYEEGINKIERWVGGCDLLEEEENSDLPLEIKIENMKNKLEIKIRDEAERKRKSAAEEQERAKNLEIITEIRPLLQKLDELTGDSPWDQIRLKAIDYCKIRDPLKFNVKLLKNIKNSEFLALEPEKDLESLNSEIAVCCGKIENSKYSNATYMNFLDLGSKNSTCPLCKTKMAGEVASSFIHRLDSFLKRQSENKAASEGKLTSLKATIELYSRENSEIALRNQIRSRILELIRNIKGCDAQTDCDSDIGIALESLKGIIFFLSLPSSSRVSSPVSIDSYINQLSELERRKTELHQLKTRLAALPQPSKDTDVSAMKLELKEKRMRLSNITADLRRQENERRLMTEEKENRMNIERRDRFIKEIESREPRDLKEIEIRMKEKEVEIRRIRNEYERRMAEIEMRRKRRIEGERRIKELKERIGIERLGIERRYKDEVLIFDGERVIVEEDEEYERIRGRVLSHKNGIIRLVKEVERMKHELKVVEENIKLRKKKERILEIEAELKAGYLISDNCQINIDNCHGSVTEIKERRRKIEERRIRVSGGGNILRGEMKQLLQMVKEGKEELEKSGGGGEYVRCQVEIRALELSEDDLEKCIVGLDKAIVEFHRGRIEEVNRTLRELWSLTYRGSDIDYIELKAETKERQGYDYRMVMVKSGVELEMRGRSSAGQKMIGSILFRIALAEVFSEGCKVLALDEPTTNLDVENMESLGQTLTFIIKERRDFQLIVITHDEDFVSLLSREGSSEYYRLKRDGEGRGYIEECSIYKQS